MSAIEKYGDLIYRDPPVSVNHKRMDRLDRAAQFAPFAALTGYEDAVFETARETDSFYETSEDEKAEIDAALRLIEACLDLSPLVSVSYFQEDLRKSGGSYRTLTGRVKKIDRYKRVMVLEGGFSVDIDALKSVSADLFEASRD